MKKKKKKTKKKRRSSSRRRRKKKKKQQQQQQQKKKKKNNNNNTTTTTTTTTMTTATTAPKNPRNLFEEQRPARTGHQPDEELDDEESKDGVLAVGQPRIAVSGPVLVYQGQGRKDQLRRQVQAAHNTMVTITITITITLTIMINNPLTLPAVVRCGTLHQLSPPLTVMGKVCLLVGCLTSQCISGTDLLRQFYVLSH